MTTADRPAPLLPQEVTLVGCAESMPLYGDRLFKSETWIAATAEGKVAALRLWWHAFAHEKPGASLPNNDRNLAEYAGYGTIIRAWARVRTQAMRGWVLCSDDRWWHPILAEIVQDEWERRKLQSRRASARWVGRAAGGAARDAARTTAALEFDAARDAAAGAAVMPRGRKVHAGALGVGGTPLSFVLPPWINPDAWNGYVEMRKRSRHPLTERAKELTIADLAHMRERGLDPNASLDQSTKRNWRGVYDPKPNGANGPSKQEGLESRNRQTASNWKPPESRS